MIKNFIESKKFQNSIAALIVFNGIILGLATSKNIMSQYGEIIELVDMIIVAIFTIEIVLRISVYKSAFFKDPWSLFDFFVVAISLIPANENLSILRALRVLRLFRLLTIVPQMRIIVAALLGVIPGIASISMVLLLFFYVFAIMAVGIFGETFPQWFGSLGESMYTLFQIMTLESWSMGIARPVMEVHPYAWIYFVVYILIVTFIMVNLFVGLIVDAIFTIKGKDQEENKEEDPTYLELQSLRSEVAELKSILIEVNNKSNR